MILIQLSGDVILWSVANVGEQGVPGGEKEVKLVKYYKHFGVSIRFKKNNWLL